MLTRAQENVLRKLCNGWLMDAAGPFHTTGVLVRGREEIKGVK